MRQRFDMRASRAVLMALGSLGSFVGCGSGAPHAPPTGAEIVSAEPTERPRVSGRRPPMTLVRPPGPSATVTAVASEDPFGCVVTVPASFGAGCRALVPQRVFATGSSASAESAFDGSRCTAWSSGGTAPQSITVDLGAPMDIDALVLIPEMGRSGAVTHAIEVSDDGETFAPSQRIEAPMSDGSAAELRLPVRERARFVRFKTEASPTLVGWRDISIVQCAR